MNTTFAITNMIIVITYTFMRYINLSLIKILYS